jgi:hypothetical protein
MTVSYQMNTFFVAVVVDIFVVVVDILVPEV